MEPTSQSRYRSTAPLPRGASGEEKKLYEMPRPPLNRGGGSASALTERLLLIVFSRQGIALAGYRCTVEFVVDGLVVVNKACFHHDFAAGGVLHGVGAGKPITVCILEPVFYQSFQSFGGAAFAPPCSANAVARLPDALGEVESRPFISLCRFSQQAVVDADGTEHLPGGLSTMAHW